MNGPIFTVIILLLCNAALIFVLFFTNNARIRRKLLKTPVTKLSEFKSGAAGKIKGKVEIIGDPIIAPLSQRKCAYYHVVIKQRKRNANGTYWKTIIEKEVSGTFVIKDGNDYAYIESGKIESYIILDKVYNSGLGKDAHPVLEAYLKSHGYNTQGTFGLNNRISYKEGILEKGEVITVLGKGEWKDAQQAGLPASYKNILAMSPDKGKYIYLSDDPDVVKGMVY